MYTTEGYLNELVTNAMTDAYNHAVTDARIAVLLLEWKRIDHDM